MKLSFTDATSQRQQTVEIIPDSHGMTIEIEGQAQQLVLDFDHGKARVFVTDEEGEVVDGPALVLDAPGHEAKPDQLYMDLTFLVSGHVNQTLKMHKDIPAIQVIESLNDGSMMTTIQEGSQCIMGDGEVIATVVDVDNECSYEDFEGDASGGRYRLGPANEALASMAGAMRAIYIEGDDK